VEDAGCLVIFCDRGSREQFRKRAVVKWIPVRYVFLVVGLSACSSPTPYATTVGVLKPGATLSVDVAQGDVNVYRPEKGQPSDRFTIAATAQSGEAQPASPTIRPSVYGVSVTVKTTIGSLLVRVPDGVHCIVRDKQGDVRVTDITGSIDVEDGQGNVTIMVPGYAQASTQQGSVNATFGAAKWPGTLRFTSQQGDVNVYVPATTAFQAYLHTGDGTVFSDFPGLRGTSQGKGETVTAPVNGGASQGVYIETGKGVARLLRLTPQA
jgi:hypothetical protein